MPCVTTQYANWKKRLILRSQNQIIQNYVWLCDHKIKRAWCAFDFVITQSNAQAARLILWSHNQTQFWIIWFCDHTIKLTVWTYKSVIPQPNITIACTDVWPRVHPDIVTMCYHTFISPCVYVHVHARHAMYIYTWYGVWPSAAHPSSHNHVTHGMFVYIFISHELTLMGLILDSLSLYDVHDW